MADPLVLDPAVFRIQFPEFSIDPPYSDIVLQAQYDIAVLYVSDENCGTLTGKFRLRAIYLMMAHLMRLAALLAADGGTGTPGIVTGATIDKVTVSLEPPPKGDNWTYWLNQTPYGQDLLAYLQLKSVGGWMVGGLPEVGAFRRVGGVHWPRGRVY